MSAGAAAQGDNFDVLVVGGGINGAGIARDLAGRDCKVLLVEQDDLAAHTSSSSTKLVHGGLRYLEYREFALVRKSLLEREVLLGSAPHIMWPLRFVMPHHASMRPAWLIRLGLFFYDHMARRKVLPGSSSIDLRLHVAGEPLQPHYTRGFVYSDGWVDDARLVVLNAVDAHERGAEVLTRTRCVAAQRGTAAWTALLRGADGVERTVQARLLVNAAGPWAEAFLRDVARPAAGERLAKRSLRLVKGSHIVVPRCHEHDHAYLFQNADKRIVFAIPYERDFTLIGTTEVELPGAALEAPRGVAITAAEVAYLCAQVNRYFKRPVTPADVVWSYAGVRPVIEDDAAAPAASTRDYHLESDTAAAPLLTVWGGKITTYRKLAEEAADRIGRLLHQPRGAWTATAKLPGGDLAAWIGQPTRPDHDFERFLQAVQLRHPWLGAPLALRLARAYGSRIGTVLGNARQRGDLGIEIAPDLHEHELRYLQEHEWAQTADDVLWRRSKLGLHITPTQATAVADWIGGHAAAAHDVLRPQEIACN